MSRKIDLGFDLDEWGDEVLHRKVTEEVEKTPHGETIEKLRAALDELRAAHEELDKLRMETGCFVRALTIQ